MEVHVAQLHAEISQVRSELKEEIAQLRSDMEVHVAQLHAEISQVR